MPDAATTRTSDDAQAQAAQKLWQNRLRRAKEFAEPYWDLADDLKREYLGRKDPRFKIDNEGVGGKPVNLVASFVNVTRPAVLPANPWPFVDPLRGGEEFKQGAELMEARLRQVFDRPESQIQMLRAGFDAFFCGGYLLIGWRPNTSQYIASQSAAGGDTGQPATDGAGDPPAADVGPVTTGQPDEPFIRHIGYRSVLVDPDALAWEDKRWVAYEVDKPLREIKAADVANGNPGAVYSNTEAVKADNAADESPDQPGKSQRDNFDATVKVRTIFHRGRRPGEVGVLVMAGSNYTVIRQGYINFGVEGFPIRRLTLYTADALFDPNPLQFWIDLHDGFNEFLREMVERASQAKRIIIVPDEETKNKISTVGGNTVVVGDKNAIAVEDIGGTVKDTWDAMTAMERFVDKISGMDDLERGLSAEGDQTATEINQRTANVSRRLTDFQESSKRFLRGVARDLGGALLAHQWQDVPVRVGRGGGRFDFATFSNRGVPADITAYDFDFDVSDHERQNPLVRQKRTQDTLAILADPNMQQAAANEGKRISVVAALEDHLEAIGVRDMDRYVQDLPDPMQLAQEQQAKAQAENQQMAQTEQPVPVDPQGDDHQIHAQVHMLAADQSAAVAEHLAEHYGFMQANPAAALAGAGRQAPQPTGPAGPRPSPRGGGIVPAGPAQLLGQARSVA